MCHGAHIGVEVYTVASCMLVMVYTAGIESRVVLVLVLCGCNIYIYDIDVAIILLVNVPPGRPYSLYFSHLSGLHGSIKHNDTYYNLYKLMLLLLLLVLL